MISAPEIRASEDLAPVKVPDWVYRLDVEPPARHEAWHRAMRILRVRRTAQVRRRRAG